MPLSKLVFKPGINRDQTDYASEGGWYEMDKVRFRSGFPEKIGGWTVRTLTAYEGVARSLFTWATTDGGKLIGIGTNQKPSFFRGFYTFNRSFEHTFAFHHKIVGRFHTI